jgi:hypothetical protein
MSRAAILCKKQDPPDCSHSVKGHDNQKLTRVTLDRLLARTIERKKQAASKHGSSMTEMTMPSSVFKLQDVEAFFPFLLTKISADPANDKK